MRLKTIVAFMIAITSSAMAQNYSVDWYVIANGGGAGQSENYRVDGTAGQPAIGISTSANYSVQSGFWVGVVSGGCDYVVGDINGSGSANGVDVVYGVMYLKGGDVPPDSCDCRPEVPGAAFYASGDVNGNCAFNGIDITYFVTYLKGQQAALLFCPDCPPANDVVSGAVVPKPQKGTVTSGWKSD